MASDGCRNLNGGHPAASSPFRPSLGGSLCSVLLQARPSPSPRLRMNMMANSEMQVPKQFQPIRPLPAPSADLYAPSNSTAKATRMRRAECSSAMECHIRTTVDRRAQPAHPGLLRRPGCGR